MIAEEEEEPNSNNGRNILVFGRLFEERRGDLARLLTPEKTLHLLHGGEERGHCERDEGVGTRLCALVHVGGSVHPPSALRRPRPLCTCGTYQNC